MRASDAPLGSSHKGNSMNLSCYLPDWITHVFGIKTDDCAPRHANVIKSLEKNQVDAYQFYDGLMGKTPDAPIRFPVYETDASGRRTGRSGTKTTSIRQLAILDNDWQQTSARLQSVYDRCVRAGIITERPLNEPDKAVMLRGFASPVTSQTRDPAMADPRGILRAPWANQGGTISDPYYPTDPRGVPGWYPNVSDATPVVSLTPRVLDKTVVNDNELRTLYQDIINACFARARSFNAPLVFHPLAIGAQSHIYPNRNAYSNVDNESGSRAIAQWATDNNDPNYLIQNSVFGFSFPEGNQLQGPQFGGKPTSWLWNESLSRRFPLTIATGTTITRGAWDSGESRRTWNLYTADALLELQRWVNVMSAMIATGNTARDPKAAMVDVFACQSVYQGAQEAAYRQINRPFGSNVLGYREKISAEAAARKAAQRGSLGVPGYESTGDDTADISMGIIGSVALAVQDGIKAGAFPAGLGTAVVSALIRGCLLMYSFLTGPDTEPNPYDYPLRMGGGGRLDRTPAFNGITVKNALELSPVYRVR